MAFLDHLEKHQGVSTRSRNLRLTAIRSFFRFAAFEVPTYSAQIQRVLAIPSVVRQKFHDIRWRCSLRRFVDLAAVRFPTSGIRSGGDGGAVGKIWGVV
jgi:hypothetical protein